MSQSKEFCSRFLLKKHFTFLGYFSFLTSPCAERIGARASIHTRALVYTSDCSLLFGRTRALQDLCIGNLKYLVVKACQLSNLR